MHVEVRARPLLLATIGLIALSAFLFLLLPRATGANDRQAPTPAPTATATATPVPQFIIRPVNGGREATPAGRGGKRTAVLSGAAALNVRAGPGVEYEIVGGIFEGDVVEVLEVKGDWARVRLTDGREGWASTAYLEIREEE